MTSARVLALTLAPLLLIAGCGAEEASESLPAHPASLVGTYRGKADAYVGEVTKAMRYGIRKELESDDPAVAKEFARRLEASSRAWAKGLENELELRADGSLIWLVLEPKTNPAGMGVLLIDLSPPEVPAVYRGTWKQVAPGEIAIMFRARNGRTFRYPEASRCRVRADGGLDVSWARDDDMSIEEQPLYRD